MLEYVRLALFLALLLAGLTIQAASIVGVNRFRYSANRLHSAGMGDTLGLMLIALAGATYLGFEALTLKILCMVALFWITGPVCTHLIARLIRETDEDHFHAEAKEWKS